MIVLDATTKKLQALMDAVATTTESPLVASYDDIASSSTTYTAIGNDSITNGVTAVDLVAAPAASTQRIVKFLSCVNADTVPRTITFRYNDNGTARNIMIVTLQPNDSITYSNGQWTKIVSGNNAPGNAINALINPHGIIAQRGNVAITNNTAQYGVDRWKCILNASTSVGAGNWGQKTGAPNGLTGFAAAMLAATWTGTATLKMRQGIEAKDACKFISQTGIFSANIYQDTGATVSFTMNVYYMNTDDSWDGNASNITLIGGASTNVPSGGSGTVINSGALSIPANATHGLVVEISVATLGTTLTTKNVYVTSAQFQLGSVVTTCEDRCYQDELSRCQRYCYGILGGVASVIALGELNSTSAMQGVVFFPVPLRIVPSFTRTGTLGNYTAGNGVTGSGACTGLSLGATAGTTSAPLNFTATGTPAGWAGGQAGAISNSGNTADSLVFNADF